MELTLQKYILFESDALYLHFIWTLVRRYIILTFTVGLKQLITVRCFRRCRFVKKEKTFLPDMVLFMLSEKWLPINYQSLTFFLWVLVYHLNLTVHLFQIQNAMLIQPRTEGLFRIECDSNTDGNEWV